MTRVRRALVSTADRTGVAELAQGLVELGVEILSTGGTGAALREAGIPVTEVAGVTGFPEILDGRVKTLHPRIHAGLLALRGNDGHLATLREHGIEPIDLVCVNLYPFERTIGRPGCTLAEAIEQIDIGGPCMLRSAAKNCESIYVLSSPDQYGEALEKLRDSGGVIDPEYGRRLALEAYRRTARYDRAIASYLAEQV